MDKNRGHYCRFGEIGVFFFSSGVGTAIHWDVNKQCLSTPES